MLLIQQEQEQQGQEQEEHEQEQQEQEEHCGQQQQVKQDEEIFVSSPDTFNRSHITGVTAQALVCT